MIWTPSLIFALAPMLISEAREDVKQQDKFYDAIWAVESSRQENPPDGDGGKAIGPYQIHEVYCKDAKEYMPEEIDFQYQDCKTKDCAEAVIRVYMLRYARRAWQSHDFETLARIHNGGPKGHKKKSTLKYWEKVQKVLKEQESGEKKEAL